MQGVRANVALCVKGSLALFCKKVELGPSCGVLGKVVVVEMEILLVHKPSAKLSIKAIANAEKCVA